MMSLEGILGEGSEVVYERDFQLLLLITVTVPFGNGLLSPILDSLINPLGASVDTIGLMISVFWAPSIIVIPFVGILADRYGRKPVIVPSLLLFGIPGVVIAFTTDFIIALSLRFLQGIGWAGLAALLVTSIGDMYAGSKETTAQGLRQTVAGFSVGAISLLSGMLVEISWSLPFLLYSLILPVSIGVYMWFKEPTRIEKPADNNPRRDESYWRNLLGIITQPQILFVLLARPLPIAAFTGFLTYNSVLIVRLLDGSPTQAGVLFAGLGFIYATASSQVGRLSQILGGRYRTLLVANTSLGGGLVMVFLAPDLFSVALGTLFVGIGFGITLPVYRSIITGFATVSLRAGLVSISATISRTVGVLTPILMGGAIAIATPSLGFAQSIQVTGLGLAAITGGGGCLCIVLSIATSANNTMPSRE